MNGGERLSSYHTPNGNLITLYRIHERGGWATSCERLGGDESIVFIPDRRKAREHYSHAYRHGDVYGAFR